MLISNEFARFLNLFDQVSALPYIHGLSSHRQQQPSVYSATLSWAAYFINDQVNELIMGRNSRKLYS